MAQGKSGTAGLRGAITTQESPAQTLQAFLKKHQHHIAAALPQHLNAERMCRLALTSFSDNEYLQKCTPRSVFASIIKAAQMGLEIGVAGQGYLVPYKNVCTFVPGWQGMVDLVSRSGRGAVWTGAVYEGDEFDWTLGSAPFIKHKPQGDERRLIYTYAVGYVTGSNWPIIEVWSQNKLEKHRDRFNKVGERHYSFDHWEMYARKVPLMQVVKYMPKSVELTIAVEHESDIDTGRVFDNEPEAADEPPAVTAKGDDKKPDAAAVVSREVVSEFGEVFGSKDFVAQGLVAGAQFAHNGVRYEIMGVTDKAVQVKALGAAES